MIAEVVVAAFEEGERPAGGGAHAVAVRPFDDAVGGGEGGAADGIVFGAGPESEDDEIGMMILPPKGVENVLLRNPKNRIDGIVWRV